MYFESISKWEQIVRGQEWILVATNLVFPCGIPWLWRWVSITKKQWNGVQGFDSRLSSHHLLITDHSWNFGDLPPPVLLYLHTPYWIQVQVSTFDFQPSEFSYLLDPPLWKSPPDTAAFGLKPSSKRVRIWRCHLPSQSGQGGVLWHHPSP